MNLHVEHIISKYRMTLNHGQTNHDLQGKSIAPKQMKPYEILNKASTKSKQMQGQWSLGVCSYRLEVMMDAINPYAISDHSITVH